MWEFLSSKGLGTAIHYMNLIYMGVALRSIREAEVSYEVGNYTRA